MYQVDYTTTVYLQFQKFQFINFMRYRRCESNETELRIVHMFTEKFNLMTEKLDVMKNNNNKNEMTQLRRPFIYLFIPIYSPRGSKSHAFKVYQQKCVVAVFRLE